MSTTSKRARKPIIVALDYADPKDALALAARLEPTLCQVKVGKELYTAGGPQVVEALQSRGFDVFIDLKYHDIPNTVAGACRAATKLGAWMINVHAAGGRRMMEAATEAVAISTLPGRDKPILIAVTMLTSMSAAELPEIGLEADSDAVVARYAALAHASGMDGIVCSAQESPQMKQKCGAAFQLITPGIRLADDAKGDQSRVVTPVDAIKMGSDFLVIGRSVTNAKDPIATLAAINHSIESVL
jgi:orotidine-5'-phosphate decarboxylase